MKIQAKLNLTNFNKLLNDFTIDTKKELWTNYEELRKFTSDPDNINKFIKGELGSNMMLKYKSRSYTWI